jgi:hypothetical protein
MSYLLSDRTTKEWFVLSLVGSVSTTAILLVIGHDTDKDVARLEQRVKALEGSASIAKDEAADLSKRIDGVQAQFWE